MVITLEEEHVIDCSTRVAVGWNERPQETKYHSSGVVLKYTET